MPQTALTDREPEGVLPDGEAAPAHPTLAGPTMAPRSLLPLGQILVEDGAVDPGNLLKATVMRRRENARLGQILLGNG